MVRSAAIIFYVDTEIHILLVKPSDPNFGGPDFQIPKGLREPGEPSYKAAEREAEEEAGLNKGNTFCINFIHTFGCIDLYSIEVKSMEGFNKPDYEIAETKWFTLTEAFHIIRPWQKAWLGKFLHWTKEMHYAE